MKKLLILLILFIAPVSVSAQSDGAVEVAPVQDVVFKAEVLKVTGAREIERENGMKAIQQDLLLIGLDGEYKGQEVNYKGISDIDVANSIPYSEGDTVYVTRSVDSEGNENFYVTDYSRTGPLALLALLFSLAIIIIGRKKGVRALIGLVVSFLVIMEMMLPLIMKGYSPLLVGLAGSFLILSLIIFISEGWKKKTLISIVAVIVTLAVTFVLSYLFTRFSRLSGLSQEDAVFLIGAGRVVIDFKGLLLAGILIGAIGVLDDVIVGQVEAVEQIWEADPELSKFELFKRAYKVGNTHLGAIVNTLFLTYTGASLPLLLLFFTSNDPNLTYSTIINNEAIATEIVRTLAGSIGVAFSLPVSTYLAAYWQSKKAIIND